MEISPSPAEVGIGIRPPIKIFAVFPLIVVMDGLERILALPLVTRACSEASIVDKCEPIHPKLPRLLYISSPTYTKPLAPGVIPDDEFPNVGDQY